MRILPDQSYAVLLGLAARLRALKRVPPDVNALVDTLGREGAAALLDAVAAERRHAEVAADKRVEFVWSGPEREGAGSRDTAAVVRELFTSASESVDVSGYAVHDGESIFADLARRMTEIPDLAVRLFINVHRGSGDVRTAGAIVAQFRHTFLHKHWPWKQRPTVYFDPRSLELEPQNRAVMHAKCIIVDRQRALVTSANLTEAAQYRNLEAGVLLNDAIFARNIQNQFSDLIALQVLSPLVLED